MRALMNLASSDHRRVVLSEGGSGGALAIGVARPHLDVRERHLFGLVAGRLRRRSCTRTLPSPNRPPRS
ncbi:MAG: hypothetical protein MZU97_05150 [Bacillus subtilis]|nr:hypothetical protein [Bacillus subtilis]